VQAFGLQEGTDKTWAFSCKVGFARQKALVSERVVAPDPVLAEPPAMQTAFLYQLVQGQSRSLIPVKLCLIHFLLANQKGLDAQGKPVHGLLVTQSTTI